MSRILHFVKLLKTIMPDRMTSENDEHSDPSRTVETCFTNCRSVCKVIFSRRSVKRNATIIVTFFQSTQTGQKNFSKVLRNIMASS